MINHGQFTTEVSWGDGHFVSTGWSLFLAGLAALKHGERRFTVSLMQYGLWPIPQGLQRWSDIAEFEAAGRGYKAKATPVCFSRTGQNVVCEIAETIWDRCTVAADGAVITCGAGPSRQADDILFMVFAMPDTLKSYNAAFSIAACSGEIAASTGIFQ